MKIHPIMGGMTVWVGKFWLSTHGVFDIMKNAWECSFVHTPTVRLSILMAKTRKALWWWNATNVGNIFRKGENLYQQIYDLQVFEATCGFLSHADHCRLLTLLRSYNHNLYQ